MKPCLLSRFLRSLVKTFAALTCEVCSLSIFAQDPEKAWGTHINICTPLSEKQPYHCGNNRYFTTLEEALADEQLKKAPALRGYRTRRRSAVPAGWDYYQVVFNEKDIVVSQENVSLFDGP